MKESPLTEETDALDFADRRRLWNHDQPGHKEAAMREEENRGAEQKTNEYTH